MRINPYELHINDPDYYDKLYSGPTQKRDKWEWSAKMFGGNGGSFGTIRHEQHRLRRAALSPYFSKQSVTRLEPTIRSTIEHLCTRFKEFQKTGTPVELEAAYAALTLDIITDYAFAKPYGALSRPDFAREWPKWMMTISASSHIIKQFGWLLPLMRAMPAWFALKIDPGMVLLIQLKKVGLSLSSFRRRREQSLTWVLLFALYYSDLVLLLCSYLDAVPYQIGPRITSAVRFDLHNCPYQRSGLYDIIIERY